MRTFHVQVSKYSKTKAKLGEVLQEATSLGFDVLADACAKGAVWHQKKGKGKILRLRSLHIQVDPEDKITFYFDPKILALSELKEAACLYQSNHYGVWHKPAGVLPQGTQTGDHTSLLRLVEKERKKDAFLVHRLDRETEGLMVVGLTAEGAAKLSELFQKNLITKTYEAVVKGEMRPGSKGTINESLDGKEAITHYEVLKVDKGMSLLNLKIDTGRLHQIRRHLDFIGHPVMGDPKYGQGNKNRQGLKLLAKSLSFQDPWTCQPVVITIERSLTI